MDNRTQNSKKENDLSLRIWNGRTMLQAGKMEEIAAELNKIKLDVVVLQEIRRKGAGRIEKKKYSLFYSGNSKKAGPKDIGFWINQKMKN